MQNCSCSVAIYSLGGANGMCAGVVVVDGGQGSLNHQVVDASRGNVQLAIQLG
jgi:hypothetical protein